MALVGECDRCGLHKVIDTSCSKNEMVCFECIDSCPDLQHQLNCRVAIARRIEKNHRVATLHDLLTDQEKNMAEAYNNKKALEDTLREIDPCPECNARLRKRACAACNGTGYNPKPSEEALSEKVPPPTF